MPSWTRILGFGCFSEHAWYAYCLAMRLCPELLIAENALPWFASEYKPSEPWFTAMPSSLGRASRCCLRHTEGLRTDPIEWLEAISIAALACRESPAILCLTYLASTSLTSSRTSCLLSLAGTSMKSLIECESTAGDTRGLFSFDSCCCCC
jgi:hypothetical protein